jgi:2',5'-phosphodiesterase
LGFSIWIYVFGFSRCNGLIITYLLHEFFYSYLLKELLGYNADIMCLQEVDNKIFDGDLNPIFSQNEYEGAFSVKGGVVTEGLACFWNSDKFEKLNDSRMVLAEAVLDDDSFTDILGALNINEALKENFLRRTTALQTVILKSKNHSEGLIIGNTHLFFKPDADHIRLLQTAMIVRQLEKIKTSAEKNFGLAFSVLLCGDFNSTPPFGVLEFMQQKVIKENHTDWCSAEGIVQFYSLI